METFISSISTSNRWAIGSNITSSLEKSFNLAIIQKNSLLPTFLIFMEFIDTPRKKILAKGGMGNQSSLGVIFRDDKFL
jgi:hypothetical protein